jgi:hypothetical protein
MLILNNANVHDTNESKYVKVGSLTNLTNWVTREQYKLKQNRNKYNSIAIICDIFQTNDNQNKEVEIQL